MPADDHDERFERALAQHLRGNATGAGCPDPETLAAYHERTLSSEEMAQWKQHLASCAACQETLALMEASEGQLAEEWQDQLVGRARSLIGAPATGDGKAASQAIAGAGTPVAMPKRQIRPRMAKWAIPLGAMAATVLIAIGIYEQRGLKSPESKNIEVAHNEREKPSEFNGLVGTGKDSVPVEQRLRQDEREQQVAKMEPGFVAKAPSNTKKMPSSAATDSLQKDARAEMQQQVSARDARVSGNAPAAPPPPPPSALKEEERRPNAEAVGALSEAKPEVAAAAPSVPTATGQGYAGVAAGKLDDEKRAAETSKTKKEVQQQSTNLITNGMLAKQGVSHASVEVASATASVIPTPDHQVSWKLDSGETVKLTTDGGETWKTIETGAAALLTSGSAPTTNICWIAGRAGTLVMTIDRGGHWTVLPVPIAGDLGGVHALDAKHASIWDSANRQSFETTDGGKTWKRIANE